MLLRESGDAIDTNYELMGVTNKTVNTGVENEDVLLDFADAIWGNDSTALDSARDALNRRMGGRAVVEASITAANFGMVDRIANAIGIPLDEQARTASTDFRTTLGLEQFPSARNTFF